MTSEDSSAPMGAETSGGRPADGLRRGRDVRLDGVSIIYPNGFQAVAPTDLTIRAGEFFSILGPSGCGKTTLLRTISGFLTPSAGRVRIGGEDMAGVGPNTRPTALIFQSLALFPLMKVWENVAFGLEARGVSRRKRREKAQELLALVALEEQADKKPSELSGGQRQRVAVARALAVEPAVLLLDEPLSALDLKLRQHMRAELRAIQRKTGVTFVYITHDQGEALTMSDRVAVMNKGVVEQIGDGDQIYDEPDTAFVASFVGETNVFRGEVLAIDADSEGRDVVSVATRFGVLRGRMGGTRPEIGGRAMIFVRPERLTLAPRPDEASFDVVVRSRALEGPFVSMKLAMLGVEGREKLLAAHLTNVGAAGRDLVAPNADGRLRVGFSPQDARVLPEGEVAATGGELADAL